eukprot:1161651-Pelagomonas_calceolata.AAC.2
MVFLNGEPISVRPGIRASHVGTNIMSMMFNPIYGADLLSRLIASGYSKLKHWPDAEKRELQKSSSGKPGTGTRFPPSWTVLLQAEEVMQQEQRLDIPWPKVLREEKRGLMLWRRATSGFWPELPLLLLDMARSLDCWPDSCLARANCYCQSS